MQAIIENRWYPERGCATIPLPIPDVEYAHCMELLEQLGIGDVTASDCYIKEIKAGTFALDALVKQEVNIDELDFLARSIDRYWGNEQPKFDAMAYKLQLRDIKDLINLSFGCEAATIITDFGNLKEAGRDNYMDIHGGCAPTSELDALDGEKLICDLIATGKGTITPSGVVFDNDMELSHEYVGQNFPLYYDKAYLLELDLSPIPAMPEDSPPLTLLLPTPEKRLERLLERGGYRDVEGMQFSLARSELPDAIADAIDFSHESLYELNRMCEAVERLEGPDRDRLTAAILMAKPEYAMQVRHLAENLDLFEFIPNIKTSEELGKFMIRESGHFDYDPNLEGFYDYARYGEQRIREQAGEFNELGYIGYTGAMSLDELMLENSAEDNQREQIEQGQTMQSPFL